MTDTSKVTKLEVIDSNGRSYVNSGVNKIELSLQDDGKTLKVLCDGAKGGFIPDLKWERLNCVNDDFMAETPICRAIVGGGEYFVSLSFFENTVWSNGVKFNTLEEAKAWANEQYKNKIKEVLGL